MAHNTVRHLIITLPAIDVHIIESGGWYAKSYFVGDPEADVYQRASVSEAMKMKLYEEGEKSKAICHHCKQLVSTTFVRRDVPFSDGKGEVKNILAAVCECL